ncbi:MAG: hypothetical protein ACRDNG_02930 [Gaiellaceae bacterium]
MILAEVALETIGEMEAHELPAFALRDVSNEVRFTGGALAALTHREARELLSQVPGER